MLFCQADLGRVFRNIAIGLWNLHLIESEARLAFDTDFEAYASGDRPLPDREPYRRSLTALRRWVQAPPASVVRSILAMSLVRG
jgi:hypothetical protein